MRALWTHVWKEWREHRAVLVGIAVAVPLLTLGALFLMRGEPVTLEKAWPVFVAGAAVLAALSLATELLAGELQRGTLAFVRRAPGGLGLALAGKLVAYVGLTAAAAVLARVAYVGGVRLLAPDVPVPSVLPAETFLFAAPVVVLGLWVLFLSTWIPRGAAAAAAAFLVLGALGVPAWLAHRAWPSFRPPSSVVATGLAFVVGVPLVGLAIGLLRGHRFATRAWRPLVVSAAVLVGAAGLAYGYGFRALDTWVHLTPDDDDFVIAHAVASRDGRTLYVTAARVDASTGEQDARTARPWRVDVESGAWSEIAPPGSGAYDVLDWTGASIGACETGAGLVGVMGRDGNAIRWVDADTGATWKTLPTDFAPAELVARRRDELERRTTVRSADGRPVWMLEKRLEWRGADGGLVARALPDGVFGGWAHRWGWMGWRRQDGGGSVAVAIGVDAEGQVVAGPWGRAGTKAVHARLGVGRYLSCEGREAPRGARRWTTVDAATGASVPTPGLLPRDEVVLAVSERTVVVSGEPDAAQRATPAVVDVETGERRPWTWDDGTPMRVTSLNGRATLGDGTRVVGVGASDRGAGYVLVDATSGAPRSFTACELATHPYAIARVDAVGVLLVGRHEIVRVRWGTTTSWATRDVVFPRRPRAAP